LQIFYIVAGALSLFLLVYKSHLYNYALGIKGEAEPLYAGLIPTLIIAGLMILASQSSPQSASPLRRYLAGRPLSYWVMTWFLFELVVLTVIGTFFRGPGWSWVWPWQGS
jgi:hypothetical protein